MGSPAAKARIDRVHAASRRVERDLVAWAARRRKRDSPKFRSRVDVLEATLRAALASVGSAQRLTPETERGALYRAALAQERRLALIERVFHFFRDRLDQRDDPHLSETLRAADEIVQSLYAQPFLAAETAVPAPPIAYVEAAFTPRALSRDEPPAELKTADALLRATLERLPVGVVGLPPWCEEGPWTLVYLAHELGHHLDVDLATNRALIQVVRSSIAKAAESAGLAEWERFRVWSREIFADAFSIAAIGPVAIEAIAELERGDAAAMLSASDAAYPSPVVRLSLMQAFASRVGLNGATALPEFDPELLIGREASQRSPVQQTAAAYVSVLEHVASALAATPLVGELKLTELTGLRAADFAADGQVERWADAFGARKTRPVDASLRGTRNVLAGCWVAWRRGIALEDDAERAEALAALKSASLEALVTNAEPTTLSGSIDEAAPRGRALGGYLSSLAPEELGL